MRHSKKFARSFSVTSPVTRCCFAASFVQRVTGFLVLCFSVRHGESVVSQRVFPYITAIGIGIAAASALSFLSLAVRVGFVSAYRTDVQRAAKSCLRVTAAELCFSGRTEVCELALSEGALFR